MGEKSWEGEHWIFKELIYAKELVCGPSIWFKNVFVFYHLWTPVSVLPGHFFLPLYFEYSPYTDAELWKDRWILTLAYLSLRDLGIYTRREENMKIICRKIFWLVLVKAEYHFHQYGHLNYLQEKADQLTLRWETTSPEGPEVPVLTVEKGCVECGVCPRQTNFSPWVLWGESKISGSQT